MLDSNKLILNIIRFMDRTRPIVYGICIIIVAVLLTTSVVMYSQSEDYVSRLRDLERLSDRISNDLSHHVQKGAHEQMASNYLVLKEQVQFMRYRQDSLFHALWAVVTIAGTQFMEMLYRFLKWQLGQYKG